VRSLKLPSRESKERSYGITSIADFGIPLGELKVILEDYHDYIDIAKLAIGSAYVTPNIKDKIKLYQSYNIKPYCGGTLFEKFYSQDQLDDYRLFLHEVGIEWIEISTGVLSIPIKERLQLVDKFKKEFNVISEVGSKDPENTMDISEWEMEVSALLEAGCSYVITEGRDSGTAGIYDGSGSLKTDLINRLVEKIDYRKLIFESPNAKSQMYFINQFGSNVNLGNVQIRDVLTLEAQRRGLRAETFYNEV
jgi:phosphosulfolactate synthase